MTSMPDPASALKPVPAAMSRAVSAGGHTRARRAVTEAAQVPGKQESTAVHLARTVCSV